MGYIVRKISRAKWEPKEELGVDAISADAVTVDLRTTGNCLSFWECSDPNDREELKEIALALATPANRESDRVDKIDLAWIEKKAVEDKGIRLERSKGDTKIAYLRSKHIDAIHLDLEKIGILAKLFAHSVRKDNQYFRFTQAKVRKILSEAVQNGHISLDDLPEKIRRLFAKPPVD